MRARPSAAYRWLSWLAAANDVDVDIDVDVDVDDGNRVFWCALACVCVCVCECVCAILQIEGKPNSSNQNSRTFCTVYVPF